MKSSTKDQRPSEEPKPTEAEPAELLTPRECAKRLGGLGILRVPNGEEYYKDHRHGMARTIHGWALYEYHEAKPFELSLADYQAALKAAETFPYEPHKPALTTYAPEEYRRAAK